MSPFSIIRTKPLSRRLIAAIGAGLSTLAAVNAAAGPTFAELEARLEEHPSVVALRLETDAREEIAKAERALPDPVVSFGVTDIPVRNPGFRNDPDSSKMIGASQEIPNFGVRRARSARVKSEAAAASIERGYRLSQLRAELISRLAERRSIKERIGFSQVQIRKYDEFADIIRGQLASGESVYYRLSQIDVERADAERGLVELEALRAQNGAALVSLIGEAPDTAPPDIAVASWDGEALALYVARIADAGVSAAKAEVREGKAAFGPNVGVNFTYMQRQDGFDASGAPFAGDDWFAAGVSVSVPFWAPKRQAPRLRAARARQAGAESAYQAVYREVRARLLSLQAQHGAALRSVALLEGKAEALNQSIAATRRTYESGAGDYAPVLDAEIARLTLLSELSAERANAVAHAAHINAELVTP